MVERKTERRMNDNSRSNILHRVKAALHAHDNARAVMAAEEWRQLPRYYRRIGNLDIDRRIELFDERIRHYNGTPFYSTGNVPADIAGILESRGKRILIVPPAFPMEWRPAGFMFIPDENLSKEQLDLNDGVVTLCTLAIALTGTVVLQSSREQGRRAATLIPDYHLCVLRHGDIVEQVPEAIRKLEQVKDRPLTFFSGPSATVDIEMTRVRGVHGPRTLDVLII
jgi:L-lactate dehydrogenase complex protein LldG